MAEKTEKKEIKKDEKDKKMKEKKKENKPEKKSKPQKTQQHTDVKVKEFSSKTILLEPITTEKIVKQIELENKIAFIVNRRATKQEIKEEIESTFNSKVKSVNTHIRNNKKIAYITLKQDSPAIDIATKLGII
jgi:large subunit ribosomal protein L23